MNCRLFLSGTRRPARSAGHESRRGAPRLFLILLSLAGACGTSCLSAEPLLGRWQPPPLTALFLRGGFLSASPSRVVVLEPAASPRSLLPPASSALNRGSLASGLLPRGSRWLLSARTNRDEPIGAAEVLPPPREAGMPSHLANRAFEPLRDPNHASATVLFLSGTAMFLASFLLGMLSEPPRQPDLPPPGPGSAPLLPALITSPCFAMPSRTAS